MRATYSRFELHVAGRAPGADPPRADPSRRDSYVDPRWIRAARAPTPRSGPLPQLVPAPAGPAYVQETLF